MLRLNRQHQDAAQLVAEGELTDPQIAERVGVSRQALWQWRQRPEFVAIVDEATAAIRAAVMSRGIAVRERRIAALDDRWNRLRRVIDERAADPTMAHVPGGTTGLLVRQVKLVKVYDAGDLADGESPGPLEPTKIAREVEEYSVDTGTLAELRNIEKQAAQEAGQWTDKREHSGTLTHSHSLEIDLADLSAEELESLGSIAARMAGEGPGIGPTGD